MAILAEILSSRIRAEILRLLFVGLPNELHMREIQRRSGMSIAAVQEELRKLERLDLITKRKSGNRVYFNANQHHPLYPDIRNLVLKTSGLADILKKALDDRRIRVAFIFGSVAEGHENSGSDVDLVVIGTVGLRDLSEMLSGVTNKIGREINPHVFREEEFRERINAGDRFATNVFKSKKIFIKGGEDELKAVGR